MDSHAIACSSWATPKSNASLPYTKSDSTSDLPKSVIILTPLSYVFHRLFATLQTKKAEKRAMSFQDLQSKPSDRLPKPTGNASVAAGIFQINTAVAGFRRLVDAIGTAKDTPDLRQKLSAALPLPLPLYSNPSPVLAIFNYQSIVQFMIIYLFSF